MAKKRSSDLAAKFDKVIQLSLTDEDLDELVAWDMKPEQVSDAITWLGEHGYQFSVRQEPDTGEWAASVNGYYETCPNAGLMIFGNGHTREDATLSVLYKVMVKLEGQDWAKADSAPRNQRFR